MGIQRRRRRRTWRAYSFFQLIPIFGLIYSVRLWYLTYMLQMMAEVDLKCFKIGLGCSYAVVINAKFSWFFYLETSLGETTKGLRLGKESALRWVWSTARLLNGLSELLQTSNKLLHHLKGPPSTTVTSALGPKETRAVVQVILPLRYRKPSSQCCKPHHKRILLSVLPVQRRLS